MHINSRGAATFSQFAYSNNADSYDDDAIAAMLASPQTIATIEGATVLGSQNDSGGSDAAVFTTLGNVSSLPANFGITPSVTSESEFGVNNSPQIRTQGESPTLEIGIRFIPSVHEGIDALVNDGVIRLFRVRLALSALPATLVAGTRHSDKYFFGQFAGFTVAPSTSAGTTAALTVTQETDLSRYLTTV